LRGWLMGGLFKRSSAELSESRSTVSVHHEKAVHFECALIRRADVCLKTAAD
jgi:hypothetical protein